MGRWAQRRIRGGSQGATAALNFMLSGFISGSFDAFVTYNADLDVGDLTATDFMSLPTMFVGNSLTQTMSNEIAVTFIDDIAAETSLLYNGAAPGFLTPDTIGL